jgi:multicomponent Na+:H+ antiporter subunit A
VLIDAGSYLAGHHHLGRFYIYLLTFMAAMLQTAPKDPLRRCGIKSTVPGV